jgi:hypothetical protein
MTLAERQEFGKGGSITKSDATAVASCDCYAIQVILDSTFETLVNTNASAAGNVLTDHLIPAGTLLYGHFTSFKLADTTGLVTAFKTPR